MAEVTQQARGMGKTQGQVEAFQRAIKAHLDELAGRDGLFAAFYANEKKSISECCNFIIGEVKKSGRCGFSDDEIYGMAVHYYEEEVGEVKDESKGCRVVVNQKIELTEEEKEEMRAAAKEEYRRKEMQKLEEAAKKVRERKAEARKVAEQAEEIGTLFG